MKLIPAKEVHEAEVNLIPLIDCVFLLLIFFMCSATMSKVDSSDVNLPVATNAAEQKEEPSLRGVVNILPNGTLTPKGETVNDAKPFMVFGDLVDDVGLQKSIEEHLKIEPNMKLYIRADRKVRFAMVRRAMQSSAAAGVADVVFGVHLQELLLKE